MVMPDNHRLSKWVTEMMTSVFLKTQCIPTIFNIVLKYM